MSGTFIAIIVLAAIIGGYLIDYQKNKLKWQSKNKESDQELKEIADEMKRMKKRIENLEAIVADESFERSGAASGSKIDIELENESIQKENEVKVSQQANKVKGD